MANQMPPLDTLKHIKQIMERSSRFISLSGLSGIAAGVCAIVGAWFANNEIHSYTINSAINFNDAPNETITFSDILNNYIFHIAVLTFISAFIFAFLFTYLRSKKKNIEIWGITARRLMLSVCIPMLAGGFFLLKLTENGLYSFIVPACLLFYGLAILNASKFTLPETKYLAYSEIITGIISLWFINYGLYFWTFGFGVLHIFYGILMWWKYERN